MAIVCPESVLLLSNTKIVNQLDSNVKDKKEVNIITDSTEVWG